MLIIVIRKEKERNNYSKQKQQTKQTESPVKTMEPSCNNQKKQRRNKTKRKNQAESQIEKQRATNLIYFWKKNETKKRCEQQSKLVIKKTKESF